jgi:hypothetical protein
VSVAAAVAVVAGMSEREKDDIAYGVLRLVKSIAVEAKPPPRDRSVIGTPAWHAEVARREGLL